MLETVPKRVASNPPNVLGKLFTPHLLPSGSVSSSQKEGNWTIVFQIPFENSFQ